ncbi:MAG: tRNA (adenosine(37)-N6)-threonylcarbamoyltransferase complex dimerization subunit type 1 TsaB [Erysipelotrichaceae bacterium]|nr:tRNA (adenosine(37)-N6)-threonylcarbamoyltransferase complex dimerization subunit type 1 TsaB [Erysipelotrichaceae bacterium]
MKRLIMDTSNQYLMIALYDNDHCLEKIQEIGSKRQSENAIPALSSLLQKHHQELLDIDEMIITLGPGSYTGVRVAMTIAKTLSVISPIRIKAISSLAAYAGFDKCVSVIDARSKKVFVCAYENGVPLMNEQLMLISDFATFMKDYQDFKVVGETQVVDYPMVDVDLADHIYQLSLNIDPVPNVDALVPCYIKDVEAKKICL